MSIPRNGLLDFMLPSVPNTKGSAARVAAVNVSRRVLRHSIALGVALAGAATLSVVAQAAVAQKPSVSQQRASRVDLATRAAFLESQIAAKAGKRDARATAAAELADIRSRLADGDFKVGDRFSYTFTSDSVRSDTVSVRDGEVVTITNLPDVKLHGVLRSELDSVLTNHMLRFYKSARIRTVVLTQVSIVGSVGRPGYYWTAPDRPLADLIMIAGGPTPDAKPELVVMRSKQTVVTVKEARRALEDGRTVEQMDVRSGDEIRVPAKRKLNWSSIIQLLFVASSLLFAFIQFITWYYSRSE